jgi:ankyrin repeat protein
MPHEESTARFRWFFDVLRSTVYVFVAASVAVTAAAPTGNAPLVDAVKRQDKTVTRTLLKQKADVNAADAEGMTALHWAAHWDDLDTAKALLRAGAHARAKAADSASPSGRP